MCCNIQEFCVAKSLFGVHDMIEIGYDMKMDKDEKLYRQDKHLSYHIFDTRMITNIISYTPSVPF